MQNSTTQTDTSVFLYQLDITILTKGVLFYFYTLRDKHSLPNDTLNFQTSIILAGT